MRNILVLSEDDNKVLSEDDNKVSSEDDNKVSSSANKLISIDEGAIFEKMAGCRKTFERCFLCGCRFSSADQPALWLVVTDVPF